MAPGDSLDRSSLNSMTVAELRGICKDRGLFVSGKKSELVDSISADIGEEDELIVNEEEVVEALIMEDDDTAESETEHSELIEEVLSRLKEDVHQIPTHVEGYQHAEWILMDYLDIVIHIFSDQTRSLYNLESLWSDGVVVNLAVPTT